MDKYKAMSFPWMSKSKLGKDGWCTFQFWDYYIAKTQRPKEVVAIDGTNIHMVLNLFFKELRFEDINTPDPEKWKEILGEANNFFEIDHKQPIRYHPFRKFIYERCMEYIPPHHRSNPKFKRILMNFATLECQRWVKLNEILSNKNDIFKYFRPILLEERIELERYKMFGTIDRVDIEILPNKTRKLLIVDYKTGNVPNRIKSGLKDPSKPMSWDLGSDKMKELHFYVLLFLLWDDPKTPKVVWKLSPEMVEFLLDDKWLYVRKEGLSYSKIKTEKSDYLTSLNTRKNNKYKIYKDDGKMLGQGDVWVSIYYLGDDEPYKVIKEFNYRSYKPLLLSINDLRSRIKHEMFTTHPKYVFNDIVCNKYKNCSEYKRCKALVEQDKREKKDG